MTVAVHGSYYGYNFGDTLLCRLFADWVKATGRDVVLPLANARNARLIGAERRGPLALRSADALIAGGGGYFSEPSASVATWTLRAYVRHILPLKRAQSRMAYAIMGVGVGPISSALLRRDIARLFDDAEVAVVRDAPSAEFLHAWGVRRDIIVSVDAVATASIGELIGPARPSAAVDKLKTSFGTVVLLHLAAHPTREELSLAERVLSWLLSRTSAGIVLANDSVTRIPGSEWSRAIALGERANPRLVRHVYSGDPAELTGMLDQVDLVVTSKLHVGIVRTTLLKPVLSVPAHTKTPRFYAQMGLGEWCVAPGNDRVERLIARLEDWLAGWRPDWTTFERQRAPGAYRDWIAQFLAARTPGRGA